MVFIGLQKAKGAAVKSKMKNENALRFAQDTSMNPSEVSREKSRGKMIRLRRTKCKIKLMLTPLMCIYTALNYFDI